MLKKGGGGWSVVGVPDSALVPEGAGVRAAGGLYVGVCVCVVFSSIERVRCVAKRVALKHGRVESRDSIRVRAEKNGPQP